MSRKNDLVDFRPPSSPNSPKIGRPSRPAASTFECPGISAVVVELPVEIVTVTWADCKEDADGTEAGLKLQPSEIAEGGRPRGGSPVPATVTHCKEERLIFAGSTKSIGLVLPVVVPETRVSAALFARTITVTVAERCKLLV